MDKKELRQLIREIMSNLGNTAPDSPDLTTDEMVMLAKCINTFSHGGHPAPTPQSIPHFKPKFCLQVLAKASKLQHLNQGQKELILSLFRKYMEFEKKNKAGSKVGKKVAEEGLLPKKDNLPPEYKELLIKLEEILYKRKVGLDNSNAIVAAVLHYLLNNGWTAKKAGAIHENASGNYPEYVYYDNSNGEEHPQVIELPEDSFAKDYIEGVSAGEFKGAVYKRVK